MSKVIYNNTASFEEWLEEVCKEYDGNIEDYLDELDMRHGEIGTTEYELSKWETKSGNPECYSYSVEEICDEDGEWIQTVYNL